MASSKQDTTKEMPIEQKLKALYDLQQVNSQIDKIRTMRGELPLEVQDLEDEIAGLETRAANINAEIKKLNGLVAEHKNKIKEAESLISKYEQQQKDVRNNREYDAISKEIEYQDLDRQLSEKRIREFSADAARKQEQLTEVRTRIEERQQDLNTKKNELDTIVAETQSEENDLLKKAAKIEKNIDERALNAFHRLRANAHNGLAVVTIQREACGGCFNRIPPQRQLDIRLRKRIIVCEYCGRILVDGGVDDSTESK
ncbi:MAG: hypothetical protein II951_05325 [Bacteroidales bacterium]|jgi:hypothetical protein|nr:hypothetical protein [Bacteroidales bacterium]